MSFLLDTNVVSELRRSRPDPNVTAWLRAAPAGGLYLSVIVVGEIRRGVEKLARRGDTVQADRLGAWLARLRQDFRDRIVPVTDHIAEQWGRLTVHHQVPFVDGLLAATALVHDWTLVTRNVADVAGTGAAVLNPFEPAGHPVPGPGYRRGS